MTEQVTKVRVFIASPGDVQKERDMLPNVIEELNNTIGRNLGFVIELVRWETHCHPEMGRPQGVINEQVGEYDIFIGVMWKRFGTPTGEADSGTEEEFNLAYEEWERNKDPHIAFYFSQAKYKLNSVEETEQAAKVLKFKQDLKSKGLTWDYPNAAAFPSVVRPHLTTILFEMFQAKTTPEAPVGVVEKLRQVQEELDEASPHHRLVVNTAGEFTVRAKYPEADEEQPLKISGRFEFPKTPEGREMRDKLERSIATGEPVTIPKEYIKYLKLPDVFAPLVNTQGEGIESVTIGGFVPPRFMPIKMLLKCDDGEEVALDYIQFEPSHADVAKVVYTNFNQPVPWKFKLTLNLAEGTLLFDYAVNYRGLTAKRELDAMRFTDAMAKGGTLELIHIDTGFTFQTIKLSPGVVAATELDLIKLIEKVAIIQSKARVPIVIPEASEGEEGILTVKDIATVFETAQKMETGRAILNVAHWQTAVDLELAKKLVDLFDKGGAVSLSFSFEDESVNIFGVEIHLGMVVLTCERTTMADEDLKALREAVAANQASSIPVRFTPAEGSPMLAHYPAWLPTDQRDFLVGQLDRAATEASQVIPELSKYNDTQ